MVCCVLLQCDIYSLGVIFFELYQCFTTEMERHKQIKDLRAGFLPPEFGDNWPSQVGGDTSVRSFVILEQIFHLYAFS